MCYPHCYGEHGHELQRPRKDIRSVNIYHRVNLVMPEHTPTCLDIFEHARARSGMPLDLHDQNAREGQIVVLIGKTM